MIRGIKKSGLKQSKKQKYIMTAVFCGSACRKSLFFQKKCLFSIPIPFRTLCWLCFCATVVVCCRCVLHRLCSTTCKHPCLKLGVSLFQHPCRKPLPRGEGLCMLSWLCIVQSLWAYTPGVRAGLSVGLPPSPRLGLRPKPHF